jgi:uncharacterized repeat protein (TIGR01451 family)
MCLPLAAGQTVWVYVDEDAFTEDASFTIEVNRCARENDAFNHQGSIGFADERACPLEGSIDLAADSDWVHSPLSSAGERLFALAHGVAASDPDLDLRIIKDSDTLEYDDQDNSPPFGDAAPSVAGTPGTGGGHFTRLTHKSGATASEPYQLYSAVQWPADTASVETEPNDTPAQADSAQNAYFSGAISSAGDQDHFSFSASAGDLIFLGLDADPLRDGTPFDAALALLDASGTVLVAVDDPNSVSDTTPGTGTWTSFTPHTPGEGLVYRARTTGTYLARVGGSASGDYLLSVSIDCKVLPAKDLSLVMSASPDPVLVGQDVTYQLTVTNVGSPYPKSVRLIDELPPDVTLVSAVASRGSCNPGDFLNTSPLTPRKVICFLAELDTGQQITVTITVTANVPGTLTNRATVTSDSFDSNPADDVAVETTRVSAGG